MTRKSEAEVDEEQEQDQESMGGKVIVEGSALASRPKPLDLKKIEPYRGRKFLPRGESKVIEQLSREGEPTFARRETVPGEPQYFLTRHQRENSVTWELIEIRDHGFKVSRRGIGKFKEKIEGLRYEGRQLQRFRADKPALKVLKARLPLVERGQEDEGEE